MQNADEGSNVIQGDVYSRLLLSYRNEFNDECADILNEKEADFLKRFFGKMSLITQNDFGLEALEDAAFIKAVKSVERKVFEALYLPMKVSCNSALESFLKCSNRKKTEEFYLTNFRGHCSRNLIPLHSCKGRFIQVNDSKGRAVYVICVNCKQCYPESGILMHCTSCLINFYSSIVSITDKQLFPATWEKYHCNAVMNEQMRCIKCQDYFYLKNSTLFCKSCKYSTNPLDVVWCCVVCRKEFKSYAKVYNPLEFKLIKMTVKNALLYKILVKPTELPCKCSSTPLSLRYEHKGQCKGTLYYGQYQGKDMIICSRCKATASYNKFSWSCPICLTLFKTKSIKIYSKEDSALLNEITEQIERKEMNSKDKDKRVFSQDYSKNALKDKDEGESTPKQANIKTTCFSSTTQNFKQMGTPILKQNKTLEEMKDANRPRNLSINLRERSGSKKRNAMKPEKEEDNDDDEIPYYSQNKNHVSKRNEKTASPNQSLTKRHIPFKPQTNAIDNDPNSFYNDQVADQTQPLFKCNYKNYQKIVPQKIINLGESMNEDDSPFDNKERNSKFSLSAGNFQRIKSNRNYSNDNRTPFRLINNDIIGQKEELMGVNKRKHDNTSNDLDKYLIQPKGKANEGIRSDKLSDSNIVKTLERDLNSHMIGKREELNTIASNKKNQVSINIDSLDNTEDNNDLSIINIEDYTIITLLGQGTFGKIYLVEDKLQNIFSLKKIVLTEELDIELILKEYQLVHYLQHDNIIKIIGYCQSKLDFSSFVIYILMEVSLGDWDKEIKTHLDKQLYYTEKEIMSILNQLVSALAFLQRKKVSHRDIKPGNVLVFKNNVYKIADFGEAKKVTQSQQNKQINTLKGTELFMSPLLFNGIKTNQLDIKHNLYKSDVFSLGLCIVYAMGLMNTVIYEIRKMTDTKSIRLYLNKMFNTRYSLKLLDLVGNMLEIKEASRLDFIELEAKVKSM